MQLKSNLEDGTFFVECQFSERFLPKSAHFRWNPKDKIWWTSSINNALLLRKYAVLDAKKTLDDYAKDSDEKLDLSRSEDNQDIEIPVPEGLEYMSFQKAGIYYILTAFRDIRINKRM